jgi:hypothetical protein
MDLIIMNAIIEAGRGRRAYGRGFTQRQIIMWAFARISIGERRLAQAGWADVDITVLNPAHMLMSPDAVCARGGE